MMAKQVKSFKTGVPTPAHNIPITCLRLINPRIGLYAIISYQRFIMFNYMAGLNMAGLFIWGSPNRALYNRSLIVYCSLGYLYSTKQSVYLAELPKGERLTAIALKDLVIETLLPFCQCDVPLLTLV